MMMVEEKPEYKITTEKLEELKENIPRAGPKYRLGMYFETIHNLPHFDDISHHEDTGYTSYWETDTEVDSDFGNFIFNNVAGDSASVICIDDAVDMIRKQREEIISKSKPHYKLEQGDSPATSPSIDHPLEMSLESKQSANSHYSRTSHHMGTDSTPPPVPPPRRSSTTATDLQDHTYETLDDCKGEYLHHHQETIYFSKASDDSRGSQDSAAKPVSNDGADFNHSSHYKGSEATSKSPTCAKPRSSSLQLSKSPECLDGYRQRRKMSEPTHNRKRRLEKVSSKGSNYPPPIKGFPSGVPEEYADYLTTSVCLSSERRSPMCTPPSPVTSPSQRLGFTETHERKNGEHKSKKAAPLVIKHKGKTYLVPVVDKKLQRELEKKSKAENPSVMIRQGNLCTQGVSRSSSNASNVPRSFASPPKVDPTDFASSHRRKNSTKVISSPQKVPSKQVTHYGVF